MHTYYRQQELPYICTGRWSIGRRQCWSVSGTERHSGGLLSGVEGLQQGQVLRKHYGGGWQICWSCPGERLHGLICTLSNSYVCTSYKSRVIKFKLACICVNIGLKYHNYGQVKIFGDLLKNAICLLLLLHLILQIGRFEYYMEGTHACLQYKWFDKWCIFYLVIPMRFAELSN